MTRPADLIHELASSFADAGFPSPGADARMLVSHAADTTPSELLARWELGPEVVARARTLAQQRLDGRPVQHITGEAFFRHETLEVGPGVFIPRAETETLVDIAIELLADSGSRRVVELCAGSGAISRSLSRELAGVELYVNERSAAAADYLARNLADVDATIELGDMAVAFRGLEGTVDLVAVNPPYVPETVRDTLPRDVAHDPDEALFAGADGLAAMPTVIATAKRLLRNRGAVVIEHDESHQEELVELLAAASFEEIVRHRDLAGRPRFVSACRKVRKSRPGLPRVGV